VPARSTPPTLESTCRGRDLRWPSARRDLPSLFSHPTQEPPPHPETADTKPSATRAAWVSQQRDPRPRGGRSAPSRRTHFRDPDLGIDPGARVRGRAARSRSPWTSSSAARHRTTEPRRDQFDRCGGAGLSPGFAGARALNPESRYRPRDRSKRVEGTVLSLEGPTTRIAS
jgi:hypothetical protein